MNDPVPAVEARELDASFGRTVALRGVSLSVMASETVAIVGPSGSGKSTLLHCLAGLMVPDQGCVALDGEPFSALSERRRSATRLRKIGMVFQFGLLVPELTIRQNVALPLLAAGVPKSVAYERADECLEAVSITDVATQRPSEVSGGQMQRGSIARALVHRPSVVLADEPTGALDSASAERALDVMLAAGRAGGSAVIVVTHDADIARRCDRCVRLSDGRVL